MFFVSVVLPMLFLLFSVALDLSIYFRDQQRAQLVLDEAAMQAARALPFRERARNVALASLARGGDLLANTVVSVESDRVILSLEGEVPISFAQFFLPGVGVTFSAFASARVVPSDVYIAFDSSARTGPATPGETPEYLQGNTPATFFEYDLQSNPENPQQDPAYRTALCFNPLLRNLKRAAIDIHEYVAGFRFNAVGVGVFPAPEGLLDLKTFSLIEALRQSGDPEAMFPQGFVFDRITSEWCAAAAQLERMTDEYRFPLTPLGIEQLISIDVPGVSLIDPVTYSFNPEYSPAVSLAEAVWSVPTQRTEMQTDVILSQMLSRIGGAQFAERGGAQNVAHRAAVLLAADVPWAVVINALGLPEARRFGSDDQVAQQVLSGLGGFRTFASQNTSVEVDLFMAIMTVPATRGSVDRQREALEALLEESRRDPLSGEPQANFHPRLVIADSTEEMRRGIVSSLLLTGRNVVLSR